MKSNRNYFKEIVETLERLHKQYPKQSIGQHLSLATADYYNVDIMDKELSFALLKYEQELELNESFSNRVKEDDNPDFDEEDEDLDINIYS